MSVCVKQTCLEPKQTWCHNLIQISHNSLKEWSYDNEESGVSHQNDNITTLVQDTSRCYIVPSYRDRHEILLTRVKHQMKEEETQSDELGCGDILCAGPLFFEKNFSWIWLTGCWIHSRVLHLQLEVLSWGDCQIPTCAKSEQNELA